MAVPKAQKPIHGKTGRIGVVTEHVIEAEARNGPRHKHDQGQRYRYRLELLGHRTDGRGNDHSVNVVFGHFSHEGGLAACLCSIVGSAPGVANRLSDLTVKALDHVGSIVDLAHLREKAKNGITGALIRGSHQASGGHIVVGSVRRTHSGPVMTQSFLFCGTIYFIHLQFCPDVRTSAAGVPALL